MVKRIQPGNPKEISENVNDSAALNTQRKTGCPERQQYKSSPMSQSNSYLAKGADRSLLWLWFILSLIGVMSIFAATYQDGDNILQGFLSLKTDYSRQALFLVISGISGIFILLTDSKFFTATANLCYAFGILLMLLVFPFHSNVKGTSSIITSRFLRADSAC